MTDPELNETKRGPWGRIIGLDGPEPRFPGVRRWWAATSGIRLILLAAILAVFAVFCMARIASASGSLSDHDAAAALRASPCYGQPVTVLWDPGLETLGIGAHASGVHYLNGPGTAIVFERCEVTRNPIDWAKLTAAQRCEQDIHELGHLAGLDDGTGVMERSPLERWYGPCHTLRERVRHDIEGMVPAGAQVACGKWQGRAMRAFTCITDYADARGRVRMRAYRVRTRGDLYAMRRVAGPAWLRQAS